MHTHDALSRGESSDRISVLAAWRETAYFSEKKCSSLALVEAITLISHGQVPVIHEVIEGAFTVPDDFEAINGQLDGMKALNLKGGEQAGFARLPNPLPNTLHQNA